MEETKMKKIMILVLVIVMVIGACGCSKSRTSEMAIDDLIRFYIDEEFGPSYDYDIDKVVYNQEDRMENEYIIYVKYGESDKATWKVTANRAALEEYYNENYEEV